MGTGRRAGRRRRGFTAGVVLMAASFLVYPAYPVVVFLPLSDRGKVALTLGIAVTGWAIFAGGLWLTGRRGYVWLRRRWRR